MHIHTECVQLFEAVDAVNQEDDGASALDSLDGSGQEVGGQSLEVLEDAHPVGVAEDLVGFMIVAIPDVGRGHEHFKWILFIEFHLACFNLLVQLFHFLLSVTREPKFFLVTPKNIRSCFYGSF